MSRSLRALFPRDYRHSREQFLAACRTAGAPVRTIAHPMRGPAGEELGCDIARLGPPDAARTLVLLAATHGVEGFCGAGAQLHALGSGRFDALPPDLSVVLVHALNPAGFAWLRRTDENNVDPNRNFIDHAAPHPANPAYDGVHGFVAPLAWQGPVRERAERELGEFLDAHGMRGLQIALSAGQYDHPDGLFYGGTAPSWSNAAWRSVLATEVARAELFAVIDYHTGLGTRGACELIGGAPEGSGEARMAAAWYGDVVVRPGGASEAPAAHGYMGRTMPDGGGRLGVHVVAEFGTVPFEPVFDALRADNWLHAHGDPESELGRSIKAQMRATFYGDDDSWRSDVVERSDALIQAALRGLRCSPSPTSQEIPV